MFDEGGDCLSIRFGWLIESFKDCVFDATALPLTLIIVLRSNAIVGVLILARGGAVWIGVETLGLCVAVMIGERWGGFGAVTVDLVGFLDFVMIPTVTIVTTFVCETMRCRDSVAQRKRVKLYIKSLRFYGRDGLEILQCRRCEPSKCIDYHIYIYRVMNTAFVFVWILKDVALLRNCYLNWISDSIL